VATCFGVVADVPTIGVAKSLLCGRLETAAGDPTDLQAGVTVDGRTVGGVLTFPGSSRPLYVSPGQKMDVPGAVRIARAFAFGHRLPEPLYWADRLSRTQSRIGGK
jgi:deoxyribonuclease V